MLLATVEYSSTGATYQVGVFAEVYLGPITLDVQSSLEPLAYPILLPYALLLADQADSVT